MSKWIRRAVLALVASVLAIAAWDVATYDKQAWLADYDRLKRDMAQRYANLDWMVEQRGIDLAALDRRTTAGLENAHSRLRAFLAMRRFIRGFNDPHLRWEPGERPVPGSAEAGTAIASATTAAEPVEPPAGADCKAAGYEEGDHAFGFPFARMAGWTPLHDGDFPSGLVGDTGVLRIAQFGEDRYLAACAAVFKPGVGARALQLAVRARQQALLAQTLAGLQARGARRLLVDVTGNGGGSEWVSDVIALMTEKAMRRREARIVGPTCDRSAVWQGAPAPCPVFEPDSGEAATLQGVGTWRGPVLVLADRGTGSAAEDFVAWLQQNEVATVLGDRTAGAGCGYAGDVAPTYLSVLPLDVWMPNCARLMDDGTNEVEGIAPDIALPMGDEADPAEQVRQLEAVLAKA